LVPRQISHSLDRSLSSSSCNSFRRGISVATMLRKSLIRRVPASTLTSSVDLYNSPVSSSIARVAARSATYRRCLLRVARTLRRASTLYRSSLGVGIRRWSATISLLASSLNHGCKRCIQGCISLLESSRYFKCVILIFSLGNTAL
jgi:hypothetical protein